MQKTFPFRYQKSRLNALISIILDNLHRISSDFLIFTEEKKALRWTRRNII